MSQYRCSRPSAVVCSPGCRWGAFECVRWWCWPAAGHPGDPRGHKRMPGGEGSGPGCLWHTHWPLVEGEPLHTPPGLSLPVWKITKWKTLQTDRQTDNCKLSCNASGCFSPLGVVPSSPSGPDSPHWLHDWVESTHTLCVHSAQPTSEESCKHYGNMTQTIK